MCFISLPSYGLLFSLLLLLSNLILCAQINSCSRSRSRIARSIIIDLFQQPFQHAHVVIPDACPFNLQHDLYGVHEIMKLQNSAFDWECQQCGKRFYSEKSLDNHIALRHNTVAYNSDNAVCLADYCPLLRCHLFSRDAQFVDQMFWEEAFCEESRFSSLIKQCESILSQCVIGNSSAHENIRRWFRSSLCGRLTCEHYWEFSDYYDPSSLRDKLLNVFVVLIAVLIYYSVLFMRLSLSMFRLRVSKLSIIRLKECTLCATKALPFGKKHLKD